ncbi:MAG: shikimate kinase [Bacteroidota bacterium]
MHPPRVFLTGFMGSGKSTSGPLLADRLGYRFLDLDDEVERAAGVSISDLFARRGEPVFRALETAVLCEAATQEHVVVATGGGALATEANLLTAETSGTIVYLKLSPEALAQRLLGTDGRPLLLDEDGRPFAEAVLVNHINEALRKRDRFYSQADVTIEAEALGPEQVAEAIVQALPVTA